jgi:protein involved in polysaccharide export with SLBB domain
MLGSSLVQKGQDNSLVCDQRTRPIYAVAPILFLLLVCWPAQKIQAQIPTESDYSPQAGSATDTENPLAVDCADPLMATSAQCSESALPDLGSMANPSMSREGSAVNGIASESINRNYYDTEPLSPPSTAENQPTGVALAPEPLTEFQKFIASTTGQILPIYGASLFRNVPSTFAPLNLTPVPSGYVLGPGDELRIRIWGQVNFQASVRVDRSGDIFLPQVGPVHVAGLPFSALDEHLRNAVGRIYHNFDLAVDVGQIRAIQVYVAGEARRPGVYTVSSLSTLVDALFASGGPSVEGSLRHVEVRRDGAVVTDFDLYDLLIGGDKSKDVKLLNGDVIFIPPAGPQVAIVGSIRNPGIYEMRDGEPLSSLLRDAGGPSAVASEARVSIERIDNHGQRQAMEVAYEGKGLDFPLTDGDLIRVFSIIPKYQRTVILRGNTANPGRFAWHPGMHVSELIPDKDSLLTRNYWWKRAQLGLPAPEFEPQVELDNLRQPASDHPLTVPLSSEPWPGASNQREPEQGQTGAGKDQANEPLGEADGNGAIPRNGTQVPQGRNGTAATERESASIRSPYPAERTEVRLLAPDIDWDYAVVERLDSAALKTELIPFDLGKLVLGHDASQDIELQPGDVVTIFSQADIRVPIEEETKLVRLDGEFVHAGVYSVLPDETLRHLVARAGGFMPDAYLYGSEFTRESTRAQQQVRINEYVQSMAARLQRGVISLAASPLGENPEGASVRSGEQRELASLQQIRATGRIVLEFKPNSIGVDSLPDLQLENGDHFVVPSVPANVNVVGAVYDQNSFLYDSRRRVGGYLQLAGGVNRDADRKHEFIIRADGEVVSRTISGGPWGNEFDQLRVHPGDTIVVPEKMPRPPALREVMDWSQLFSQFALGAAALSVVQ